MVEAITSFLQEFAGDGAAVLISAMMVFGYYAFHYRQTSLNPAYSIHKVNALARRFWTENVMTNTGKDIMAVQTLRNFIMVSIMMATTASMLIVGTLTLSSQAENITRSWHAMAVFGSHSPELWIIKVLCLLVDFIVAFFSYAMSMRLATHVLFMLNVPPASYADHPELGPESVANRLIQAGNMIALGMRSFLFAIPLVFWLFGPVFLVLATIGLIVTLYHIDRHEAASPIVSSLPQRPESEGSTSNQEYGKTLAFRKARV